MVEILTVENLNNTEDIIQNIKGLLSLSDILVKHLRESTQPTHHVHTIKSKSLIECWTLDTLPHKGTSALGKLFGFIYPSIVKLVTVCKFKCIVKVNSNVHLQTYNYIIAEEACKKLA